MLAKHTPTWIFLGGGALAACAGTINAIGFLGLHHRALSHLSGPLTVLSTDLAVADLALAWHAFLVIAAFFAGCAISGYVIRQSTLKLGRRYGFVLMLESALLLASIHFLKIGAIAGDCLAAMACGLQNAMATSYSGAVIRTTHMTGIVTDLGLALGHVLSGHGVEHRRVLLLLTLLAGFFGGGVLGALAFPRLGYDTLLLPAAVTGLAGIGYTTRNHLEHRRALARKKLTPAT